jgi:hypothetical protein
MNNISFVIVEHKEDATKNFVTPLFSAPKTTDSDRLSFWIDVSNALYALEAEVGRQLGKTARAMAD